MTVTFCFLSGYFQHVILVFQINFLLSLFLTFIMKRAIKRLFKISSCFVLFKARIVLLLNISLWKSRLFRPLAPLRHLHFVHSSYSTSTEEQDVLKAELFVKVALPVHILNQNVIGHGISMWSCTFNCARCFLLSSFLTVTIWRVRIVHGLWYASRLNVK